MSINEMDSRVKELRELRRMADELAAEIESITDSIKADMDAEGVDTINGVDWKVTYKTVTASRLDTNAFKKGSAGACGSVHEVHDFPSLLHRMKKAPCLNADQSNRQRAQNTPGAGASRLYRARSLKSTPAR